MKLQEAGPLEVWQDRDNSQNLKLWPSVPVREETTSSSIPYTVTTIFSLMKSVGYRAQVSRFKPQSYQYCLEDPYKDYAEDACNLLRTILDTG